MAGRHTRGYEDIVVIRPDGQRAVRKCSIPSPPPESLALYDEGVADYIGTIWETPHYRLRAEGIASMFGKDWLWHSS